MPVLKLQPQLPETRTIKVDSHIPKNLFPLITHINNLHILFHERLRHLRNQTSQSFRELSALNENPVYTWSESGGIAVIAVTCINGFTRSQGKRANSALY